MLLFFCLLKKNVRLLDAYNFFDFSILMFSWASFGREEENDDVSGDAFQMNDDLGKCSLAP